jgi:hypothetical protein
VISYKLSLEAVIHIRLMVTADVLKGVKETVLIVPRYTGTLDWTGSFCKGNNRFSLKTANERKM